MPSVPPVPEEVHQRAGEQEQERQRVQDVLLMAVVPEVCAGDEHPEQQELTQTVGR